MKIWIDAVRPAPEGYIWCKRIGILLLLFCLSFGFISCAKQPEIIIEYIEVPVKETVCCGMSGIEYAPLNQQYTAVICSNCGKQLGELPIVKVQVPVPYEVIVEKEVVKEVQVPIEVVVEKVVEKEITLTDCVVITWEEVLKLQTGDRLENVFIKGNSFVLKFTNELYPASYQTYWTSNAKYPQCEAMTPVNLKMNYNKWGTICTDSLLHDYYTWGGIGIISGTIEEIIWFEDSYGNKTVDIIFDDNNFELKTFIDFCPITE